MCLPTTKRREKLDFVIQRVWNEPRQSNKRDARLTCSNLSPPRPPSLLLLVLLVSLCASARRPLPVYLHTTQVPKVSWFVPTLQGWCTRTTPTTLQPCCGGDPSFCEGRERWQKSVTPDYPCVLVVVVLLVVLVVDSAFVVDSFF